MNFSYPRDFKGIFIPKEIWLDDNLSAIDKFILAEIDSLDLDDSEGCYASNEYLAKFCKCSITKVSTSISKLVKLGYVKIVKTEIVKTDGRKRFLKVSLSKSESQNCKKRKSDLQKLKESNTDSDIDNKYKDKNSSIDINTDNNINTKSLYTNNMYTPVSAKTGDKSKEKPNRYISTDYTIKELKEHIKPIVDECVRAECEENEYINCEWKITAVIDIITDFHDEYLRRTGKKHRILSDKAYEKIVERLLDPPEIICEEDRVLDRDTYIDMAEKYFDIDYNKRGEYYDDIQLSLSHFVSYGIAEKLYYKVRDM